MRIRRLVFGSAAAAALLVALPGVAAAADGGTIDTGDTAWVLTSTALVMLMTPGLALFYGGLVRRKNVLSHDHAQLLHPGPDQRAVGAVGYTLAFGPDARRASSAAWTTSGSKGVGGAADAPTRHDPARSPSWSSR